MKMIGKVDRMESLYILDAASSTSLSNDCNDFSSVGSFVNNVSTNTWHHRLGHLSYQKLDSMKEQLNLNCSRSRNQIVDPCNICPLAKQRRLPFVSNNHLSKNAFDLIHCDVWGSYHVPTHAGHKFFLTLVDYCTRFTWIYFMKHKSDVSATIHRFFNMIETQFHTVIKKFRSDNAPELQFADFFASKGVFLQFPCFQRPEQNSVVERKHQHLLNVARALFFQSKVPIQFWENVFSQPHS